MSKKFSTKCTKILATVGAIDGNGSRENLEKIIKAGANGLRMNFTHAKWDAVDQQIGWIREIASSEDRNVSILLDLAGPKITFGKLKGSEKYEIKKDDKVGLTYGIEHDGGNNYPIEYDLSKVVKPGERIFFNDGRISAKVTEIDGETVKVLVENDGFIASRKGINLPDTEFAGGALTEKDIADVKNGLTRDFDYVAPSFIHTAEDVKELRKLLEENNSSMRIITKVETRQSIEKENLEDIVKASDGVMVARGDLAAEVGAEVVPVAQRRIIELCQKHCKISIVATQMLASMVDNPQPTRAEASDVATAAIDGADVVMLSEETAAGNFPVEAVTAMRNIVTYAQDNLPVSAVYEREGSDKHRDALAMSVVMLAEQLDAAAIIVETRTGKMARNVAIHRPNRRIIAVSGVQKVAQQLPLLYGTRSYFAEDIHANYGVVLTERLYEQGMFGEGPVTVVIAKSSNSQFENSFADTIYIKTLE